MPQIDIPHASTKPLVTLITLGCKLNQSETDSIATELRGRGFAINHDITKSSDYIIINTCTVTAKADRKSRSKIYGAIRTVLPNTMDTYAMKTNSSLEDNKKIHPNKKGIVIVTGCFVGTGKKDIENMNVDYIIDNSKKMYIPDIIESHEQGQILDIDALQENYFGYTPTKNIFHIRSNLKVQDGCDNFCAFCIIPMVRGNAQSRPLKDIVQDARIMAENGTKEIVLTGVNMSRYSYEQYMFSDVLEGLLKLPKDFRIRISSLEPDKIDSKFFDLMQNPRLCPHLHLCLQSGSDKILMKMRRMYTSTEFTNCIDLIKAKIPNINLTTDIIVGFPSETDKDFIQTKTLVEYCKFSHIHIFPYSHRTGTRASRMEGTISNAVKKERIQELNAINIAQKNSYRLSTTGQLHTMLVEKIETANNSFVASGLTEYYVPTEITSSTQEIKNTFIPITIKGHRIEKQEMIMQAIPTELCK